MSKSKRSSAQAIAAQMSPDAKRAFLALATDPTGVSFDDRLAATRYPGLLETPFGWAVKNDPWRLTPTGATVRAELEKEKGNG